MITLTDKLIEQGRSSTGGWIKSSLRYWGGSLADITRMKIALVNTQIDEDNYKMFL